MYPLDIEHLMTGPEGFPENLNVSRDGAEGNKINCFPRDQS